MTNLEEINEEDLHILTEAVVILAVMNSQCQNELRSRYSAVKQTLQPHVTTLPIQE